MTTLTFEYVMDGCSVLFRCSVCGEFRESKGSCRAYGRIMRSLDWTQVGQDDGSWWRREWA